jgi:C_GCAxxG_C_C family probable redox protein
MTKPERAVDLMGRGYACSQAVLAAFAPDYGLDRDQAVRLATGFAGGMASGETCGAVTGAILVLGLHYAKCDCITREGRAETKRAVQEFTAAFKAKHGKLDCRDLLGCDISTPAGMEKAKAECLFTKVCPAFVRDAAAILEQTRHAREPGRADVR